MSERRRSRRLFPAVVAVLVLALFGATLWFLWSKSRPKPVPVETSKPARTDLVRKTVASGTIGPRKEIEIKPKISGILRSLTVEAGQRVKRGDVVADVQIIPDVVNLNEAELRLRSARLNQERLERDLTRAESASGKGIGTPVELDRTRSDLEIARGEVDAAEMRVRLVREGAVARSKGASTTVEATVSGTVLAVLAREGTSVINASSFNPGTTILTVADMGDLVFRGRIDESEVGKLREGMPVEIVIGALEERKFEGRLERIAPKSVAREGATEFEIEVAFKPPGDVLIRAGYSANANIVLDRRTAALAIDEGLVQFDKERRFVEIEKSPGVFERRDVKLGLSDGLKVEVLEGVKETDVIKRPQGRPGGEK